jgi:hypothetical protein
MYSRVYIPPPSILEYNDVVLDTHLVYNISLYSRQTLYISHHMGREKKTNVCGRATCACPVMRSSGFLCLSSQLKI